MGWFAELANLAVVVSLPQPDLTCTDRAVVGQPLPNAVRLVLDLLERLFEENRIRHDRRGP